MPDDRFSRRVFNAHVALAAGSLAFTHHRPAPKSRERITALKLETSQPLEAMKRFYADTLGFAAEQDTDAAITFRTGKSTLTFERSSETDPFYHFAFNIPENQIREAHAWQRERSELIVPPKHLNDPGLAREIVAFRHWNAHSVFFWDPAGNAVEYIARHDLDNARAAPFSAKSALYISEIGLVVDDVPKAASQLKDTLNLETYVSASPEFEPIGDPHALLLLMKTGHPMAFGQGRQRGIFATEVTHRSARSTNVKLDAYPYAVLAP